MSDAEVIEFARNDGLRRKRLISEEIYLREWEEGTPRLYVYNDKEWLIMI